MNQLPEHIAQIQLPLSARSEGRWSVGAALTCDRGPMDVDVHYARSGDLRIAYATFGDGPVDFVFVPGWVSHLESSWGADASARFFRRIASFSRLIMFDKRGTGLSDPFTGVPTLEERSDDVRAVTEAVGSTSAFLCGLSEGGPISVFFAAAYPDRTGGLILIGSNVRILKSPDWPYGKTPEEFATDLARRSRTGVRAA